MTRMRSGVRFPLRPPNNPCSVSRGFRRFRRLVLAVGTRSACPRPPRGSTRYRLCRPLSRHRRPEDRAPRRHPRPVPPSLRQLRRESTPCRDQLRLNGAGAASSWGGRTRCRHRSDLGLGVADDGLRLPRCGGEDALAHEAGFGVAAGLVDRRPPTMDCRVGGGGPARQIGQCEQIGHAGTVTSAANRGRVRRGCCASRSTCRP